MLVKKTICLLIWFLFNSMLTHANSISFEEDTYSTSHNLLNTPAPTGEGFQVICYTISPTVADLEATGSQILWYTTAVGGVPLPSTTTLLNCQVYFASQTIGGIESNVRLAVTVFLIQSVITASETVVCPNATVQLSVTENNFSFEPFTILDFSSSFNSNPSSSSFNGSTLLTQAQAGNFVFNGVPFFIQPWATTLNSWSARYASGSNPRSLVLPTTCRIITDFSLFANTYWGFSGTPALLKVEFYNNNQLVYVKDLVGDDDIRDFNNSTSFTSTINNVNTLNYWTSANLSRRLDRINIPLPTPTAVDKIVIKDFGATSVQRVFVLATTLHNFQYGVSYLWSTGETSPTISVNPSTITEYWVDTTVNGQTCRKYITITVSDIVPTFNQIPPICLGASLPPLPEISTNGINGSWSPPMNNLATTTYTFTPDAGQCASATTMTIEVNTSITPDFPINLTLCDSAIPPVLNTTSPNGVTGIWNPSVINATIGGSYIFTPNPGQCGTPITLNVIVTDSSIPDFPENLNLCSGATPPILNTISPNGISGSWNPSVINNTTSGSYLFTPSPGQCATDATLVVTVSGSINPDFPENLSLCSGETAPILSNISPNGISGSWNPSVINNTTGGSYLFTPSPGQCATAATLVVTINNSITPNFPQNLSLCSGVTPPILNTISPNGISGSWSPSIINTTIGGSYLFTPNPGQCATNATIVVMINNIVIPDFPTTLSLCQGATPPVLNSTSPNGISGNWNPSVINTSSGGSYLFTPNLGQCALAITLVVTLNNIVVPDFPTTLDLCSGVIPPTLSTVSPNGITGSWNPSVITTNSSGSYLFTPTSGQCATALTLDVTIQALNGTISGTRELCVGATSLMTSNVTGGVWSSNNTTILSIDQNGIITGIQPGTTTIQYVVQSSCALILTKTITVNALPEPQLSDQFICVDPLTNSILTSVVLDSGLNSATHSFEWSLNGQPLSTTGSFHNATQEGIYGVTATNLITGCEGSTTTVVATSSQAVATSTVGADFQENQTITVTVTGGSGDYVFILNDGPQQYSPIFTNIPSGENTIIVRDLKGCDDLILTLISWQYPKFFTPNGDNINDTWDISGLENQTDSSLFIFDRYGKLLKNMRPSVGNGWNGTYSGNAMPASDYWFVLHYNDRQGNKKMFKSHFSLKR